MVQEPTQTDKEEGHEHHQQSVEVESDKLMQLVLRAIDEVGATLHGALVVMGEKLPGEAEEGAFRERQGR